MKIEKPMTIRQVSRMLGVVPKCVRSHVVRLGIVPHGKVPTRGRPASLISPGDVERIIAYAPKPAVPASYVTVDALAKALGITGRRVRQIVSRDGIPVAKIRSGGGPMLAVSLDDAVGIARDRIVAASGGKP